MRISTCFGRQAKQTATCAALVVSAATAWAQGAPMDDDDLADVWGQAMFTVENTNHDATQPFDFTKITLNADVKLNANFDNIAFGKTTNASGTVVTDVDIGVLRFIGGLSGENYVTIKDPYLQFVYKNQDNAATREVIGMRFGFGEINGILGVKFNSLKGNMVLTDGTGAATPGPTLTLNSTVTTDTFQTSTGGTQAMNAVGAVKATASKDFFISMLTEAVTNFGDGQSAVQGLSINWQNGLSYMNLSGIPQANDLPVLRVRQGG